jgi:hypothetical protein
MKTQILFLALMALSLTTLAQVTQTAIAPKVADVKCKTEGIEIAQWNLDTKARAIGFEGSYIIKDSFQKFSEKSKDGSTMYVVGGNIYKAEYAITMTLDDQCSLESLIIKEIAD